MTDRVNDYYQLPASNELVEHMRDEIGLTSEFRAIFDDLRMISGSTQLHADNIGLPLRRYGDKAALLGQRCVRELVRLAEIGLRAEKNPPT